MTTYKDTRNGMLGEDFSTKLSAWLALGCISARQVHFAMLDFEEGRGSVGKSAHGYGKGENKGTGWVRFELLWRDHMRLMTRKYKHRLFREGGFHGDKGVRGEKKHGPEWKYLDKDPGAREMLMKWLKGETGMGLIDASQRELYLTGYTSNRARQNVASYLAKHLGIDWRVGAEWYETMLIDYDVSSNWGNWQYNSITDRVFNPVKQAFDYDKKGEYIKAWVEELKDAKEHEAQGIFQAWKLGEDRKAELGLAGIDWVEKPLRRIEYVPAKDGKGGKGRGGYSGRGRAKKMRGQMRKGHMDRAEPNWPEQT